MASNIINEQEYVMCPYEKSHKILKEKIQFHLTRCEYSNKTRPFAVCPFNSTHIIPAHEMTNHKSNYCPDRKDLDNFLYSTNEFTPLFPVKNLDVSSSENWDNVEVPTYDPNEHCEANKILLLKQVAPPSEKKKFRAEERKRHQKLCENKANEVKSTRLPQTKPKTCLKNDVVKVTKQLTELTTNENAVEVKQVNIEKENCETKTKDDGFVVPKYAKRKGKGKKK